MKSYPILVGTLTISAILLTVLLVTLPMTSQPAYAEQATQGDFTLLTAATGGGADEYLTIIDNRAGKMLVYQLTGAQPGASLRVIGAFDLSRAFQTR